MAQDKEGDGESGGDGEGGGEGDSFGEGDPCYEGGGGPPVNFGEGGCCPHDRCCNGAPPECCESPDPCCAPDDPCCGSPDRCCNDDNPCCNSPDPCCNPLDECCGNSDRCCNPDNPCCESTDPCCNVNDPCCGNPDRCCNPDNPCCGSKDPCCNSSDPCCGNPDPCCNPDNPCCGSPNLCCNADCDDEDDCTRDCCDPSDGSCQHDQRPMGCSASLDNAKSCLDSVVQVAGEICNTGTCRQTFYWTVVQTGGQATAEISPASGACTLDPEECCTLSVGVTLVDGDPGDKANLLLKAESCSAGNCPPIRCRRCANPGVVTLCGPDLDVAGLSELLEESKGAFVPLNDDDDNDNGTPDKDEPTDPPGTAGEDDLLPILLDVLPCVSGGGTVQLSAPNAAERIRVYKNANRTEPVALPASWSLGTEPDVLYVEGVLVSQSVRDVRLRLKFTPNSGGACIDVVKLTVVRVDLDAANLPDEDEETAPGRLIAENDDFDENKGDPNVQRNPDDADASPVHADGSAIVTDDLVPLSRVMLPGGDGMFAGATVTLTKVGGAGTVRVVAVNPNASAPFDDDWAEVPLGDNLRDDYFMSTGQYRLFDWYAEGVAPGEVTLELKFENGPMPVKDRVTLTVVDLDVVELTFKGPGTEFFVIKKDDGSGDYGTPHWKDANRDGDALDTGPPADNRYPVAYLRDKYAQVTAVKVVYEPQGILSGTVRVFGDGPGGIDFQQDVTPASSEVTTGDVAAQNKFANEIDFFWPMNIDWRVSPDGGTVWLDAGRTSSQVYVTLNVPNTGSRYHTLLHNSCRDAKGKTTNNNGEVVAAIWSDFTDRVVRRVDPKGVTDGTQLTYYADWSCTNVTTAALLEHGDGQCGAWAKFFIDALGAQGINHADEYVVFYHVNTSFDYGFCVDDWSISGGGVSGHPTYPYLNLNANPLIQGNAYNWRFSEVADNTGVAGQGTANPASLFGNHQVVIIGNTYYDPSYGTTNASLHGIDTSAIDAYYFIPPSGWQVFEGTVNIDLNGDGDKMDTVVVLALHLLSSNSGANDLSETRYEYP